MEDLEILQLIKDFLFLFFVVCFLLFVFALPRGCFFFGGKKETKKPPWGLRDVFGFIADHRR
jgi:hypothetical protein